MTQGIKNQPVVLIVDDDPKSVEAIRLVLEGRFTVWSAQSGEEALRVVSQKNIDLMLLDIHMPGGMNGIEVLKRIKDSGENISVVMVTAANTIKAAVEAMRLGAFDYVPKPFDPEELLVAVEKAVENQRLVQEVAYLRSEKTTVSFQNMIGTSKAMKEICGMITKIAPQDVTVLIQGESGTGKELAARAIHGASLRRDKPFLALNCAGIPENLLETELFGYEKGAFTGADRQKPGKFEIANEGTLFLDEVSSLKLDMQGKILRALQEQEIERVGGTRTTRIDVRLISATNVDLKKAIQEGKFREDLYYRLNVIPLHLAPLRERQTDIPLLLTHFLEIYRKKFNKPVLGIAKKAVEYLVDYPWPGNIRELENMVERLVVLSEGEVIDAADLPFEVFLKIRRTIESLMKESIILKDARDHFEKEFITAVLEKTRWNQTEAAKVLGVHRNTLIMKTGQLGLKRVFRDA